jgi:hypothetical protein
VTLAVRLDELAALPHGWHDGDGRPIAPGCLADARDLATHLVDVLGFSAPAIAPSADLDGGLVVEWPESAPHPYPSVHLDGDGTVRCASLGGVADLDLLTYDRAAIVAWLRSVLL